MAELKAECEDAWKWLKKIPKETWCRSAMDYNCKTDLVVNNLCEVFNKCRQQPGDARAVQGDRALVPQSGDAEEPRPRPREG